MSKSTSNLPVWRSFACVATLPLVLLAVVNWMARPSPASVEVVDAFIAARAARDVRTVAALLPAEASVVDTANAMAVGGDGWYELLPLAEVLEVGPRRLEKNGDVAWSELVLDDGRPTWENNLNWFIDDNTTPTPVSQHDVPSSGRPRTMRATVTEAGITRLELGRPDDLGGPSAAAPELGVLTLIGAASVLASVVIRTFASPVVTPGLVMCGLGRWLNQRDSRDSECT
jgi:hypothetical protein